MHLDTVLLDTPPTSRVCTNDDVTRVRGDCTKFTVCVNNALKTYSCGRNMAFDVASKTCVLDLHVDGC